MPFHSNDHRTPVSYLNKHRLALVPGVDNAYLIMSVPCTNIDPVGDLRGFFALQIACELFSGTEGLVDVRSLGYAYDASMYYRSSSKQLCYTLSEASKPGEALGMVVKAIEAIVKVGVDGILANGAASANSVDTSLPDLSRTAIDKKVAQARASVTAQLHESLSTSSGAVRYAFMALLKGYPYV